MTSSAPVPHLLRTGGALSHVATMVTAGDISKHVVPGLDPEPLTGGCVDPDPDAVLPTPL